jgi:hypothetical protein
MKFLRIFFMFAALRFAYWRSTVRIVAPIVLAQYKENEIGEALLTIRSASPIVIEITY